MSSLFQLILFPVIAWLLLYHLTMHICKNLETIYLTTPLKWLPKQGVKIKVNRSFHK
jgi:hypothetical protein